MGFIYGWFNTQNHDFPDTAVYAKTGFGSNTEQSLGPGFELGSQSTNKPDIRHYQSDRFAVAITGEPVWSENGLKSAAANHGHAQALADGYAKYGKKVLDHLHGDFAFCLLEPAKGYALLAIDRIGIRPLAYYYENSLLVFGSQLNFIAAHPQVNAEIDPQAIFNYLYFHMIPSPGTIYKAMEKLQPGELVEIDGGKLSKSFYWQISYRNTTLSKNASTGQLHEQLRQAVSACRPDSQTGAFLSGGLDSSTVTGVYQNLSDKPIDAFSMGFDAEGYDEMEFARATAKHFKANLHEYYVTPKDVLDALPLIAQSYDEPFGNASAIPAYYCAKFARENGMKTLLAGDGGDEIFAGNARYAKQKMFDLYRWVPGFGKAVLEPLAANIGPLRKLNSYIEQAKLPMPDRMETYNFLHRTALNEIFAADFLAQTNADLPLEQLRQTYNRSDTSDLVKKMLFLDAKFTLADNDLRKVNRMCEIAGINVKYPMLQENMLEFAATIPSNWLMQGFELRSFYRQAMQGFLAEQTLSKSKQGFGLPFGVWLSTNSELKAFAEASLQGIEQRGFLNPDYIKNLIKLHQDGHASYYGVMVWLLIMLEQWLIKH